MPFLEQNKIPRPYVYAFLYCVLGGFFVHLYAFTNLIPNSDGINRVFDLQEMTVSGRWFLHYATFPSGFMQMPTFIGLLTLIFLGLSAVIVVNLLELKQVHLAALVGLLMGAFPSLGFTFLYMFTASAYSIGIFLAIFSLWLWEKGGNFRILALISLACSMGIYQAYAPLAIGLCVILVMNKVLSARETLKSVTIYGLGHLVFLACGAGLYYLILHLDLWLTGQELLSYLGMEEGIYPFAALPGLILSAYKQVLVFFFLPQYGTGTTTIPLAILNLLAVLLGMIALYFLPHLKRETWRLGAIFALCAIMPLAIGFGQVISPWSAPTPLMQYPYVLAYVLVLFFVDRSQFAWNHSTKRGYFTVVYSSFILISICSAWLCNLLYTASAQAHRATESYVTRIMSSIENTEGYRWDMPILIIGAFPEDRFSAEIPAYDLIDHYSAPKDSVLPLNKHIYYYLNHWLNIPVPEPSEETMFAMAESSAFLAMPKYPDYGSVQIINDAVVVKIGDTYEGKSDYELAYENRK